MFKRPLAAPNAAESCDEIGPCMRKMCGVLKHYVQDTTFGDYKITDFGGEGFGGNMRMEARIPRTNGKNERSRNMQLIWRRLNGSDGLNEGFFFCVYIFLYPFFLLLFIIIIIFTFCCLNHFYVVFICISLVICDAEHVSMCLLHSLYIFFGEMSIQVLCLLFKQVVWGFLLLSFKSSLYSPDINPLSYTWLANIFFHSLDCLFTLLTVSFDMWKCWILM